MKNEVVGRSLALRPVIPSPTACVFKGAIGLQRIPQLNPDVVTLDIEMPETLVPGGYLLLGAAETTMNLDNTFVRKTVGPAVFYHLPER